MNWYEIALGVVLVVVSLLIIVFTLAQEQKGQGLSGAIMGESSATMAAGRERGVDAKLAKLTKICGRQARQLCKQRPGGPFFVGVYRKGTAGRRCGVN